MERNKYSFGFSSAVTTSTSSGPPSMAAGLFGSSTVKEENKPLFTMPVPVLLPKSSPPSHPSQRRPSNDMVTARSERRRLYHGSASNQRTCKEPVFGPKPTLDSQWREVEWTEERKANLMKTVSSYTPSCKEVTQARVLLLGPVGSGKSSFISSVQSVFNGRVTNRAMVGSSSTSFTKKLQSFNIRGQCGEDASKLILCDVMGMADGDMTGLTLHDILSIIKGHVPEGHKFSPDQPVRSETAGYVKRPSLGEKIHCVVFVVSASKILAYPKGLSTTFQQLREYISDLGVHQVALLTHIDQVCPATAKDVSHVYKSHTIRELVAKAGAVLGMSTSYIIPVKNYSSELDLDVNTDVLLLSAVDHILQYTDLYFQDNTTQYTETY